MDALHTTYKAFADITKAPELKVDVSKIDKNFSIFVTDLYNSIEEVEKRPGPPPELIAQEANNFFGYIRKLNHMFDFKPWILITILGILTSITGVFLDFFTISLFNLRLKFAQDENSVFLSFIGFYITGFVLMMVTTSFGVWASPAVDGSGVPELKSIMSGANTYRYLDGKVFFPKFLGMCTAYGAGLQVGRAGPLVHLSAIIVNWLIKKRPFKYLDKNYSQKRSFLAASAGCGVSVALGAPIAALIFSVEIVMGFYNTSYVLRTFWGICWSLIATKAMKYVISIDPLNLTQFSDYYELDFDLFWFILCATVSALLGALFLKVTIKLIYLRRTVNSFIFDRYIWAGIAFTFVAITHFPFNYALQSTRIFYNDTYTTANIKTDKEFEEKFHGDPIKILGIYIIIKVVTMPFIFSCNIPFGIFGLPLTLGAVWGRFFAEVLDALGLAKPKDKGAYGVVGSASILACVIRGVFPAAALCETTGQIEYGLPICVGVLVGYIVGNGFSLSFFDIPIYLRKLPIMASLMSKENYDQTAANLMNPAYPYISVNAKHKEIFDMFNEMGEINKALVIPICDHSKILVGAVRIDQLLKYLEIIEEEETKRMDHLLKAHRKISVMKHRNEYTRWQAIRNFFTKTGTGYEEEVNLEGDSRMVKPSFHMKTFKPKQNRVRDSDDQEDPIEKFWESEVNWEHPRLKFDPSPLTVVPKCFASKVQFLFATTRATCIFVAEAGKFVGCITSIAFLKQKS